MYEYAVPSREAAMKLVQLDKAMRLAKGFKGSVKACLAFYLYALESGYVEDLNELADKYAPESALSERSLDLVFEDGYVTAEVSRQLVVKAGADAHFRDLLGKNMGESFIAKYSRNDLFATIPAHISTPMNALNSLPFIPTPNQITKHSDEFYVSFNGSTAIYGSETTALVRGQMQRFFILIGDHQKAYAALIPKGWDACLAYYQDNIALSHHHSDKLPLAGSS